MAVSGTGYPYLYRYFTLFGEGITLESEEYKAIVQSHIFDNLEGIELKFAGKPNNTYGNGASSLSLSFKVVENPRGTGSIVMHVIVASEEEMSQLTSGQIVLGQLTSLGHFTVGSSPSAPTFSIDFAEDVRSLVFSHNASVLLYAERITGYTPTATLTWSDSYGNDISGFFDVSCEMGPSLSRVVTPSNGATLNPDLTWDCTIQTGRDDMFGAVALSKYEIQKDINGSITTIEELLDGAPQDGKYFHLTIEPDFFTEGTTEWRIRFTNTDGLTSDWSEWIVWNTKSGVSSATPISPLSVYIDKSERVEFRWLDGVLYGGTVTQTDLRYSLDQSKWTTFAELSEWNTDSENGESYREISTESFPTGTIYWSVRTWVDDVAGNWSAGVPVIIRGTPDAPSLAGIVDAPRPRINWSSQEQAAYEVDVNGLFSIKETMGQVQSYQILEYYPNGTYTVKVRVKNNAGIWSPWAENTMRINNAGAAAPQIEARFENLKTVITVANSSAFSKMYVLRNGEPIGKITGNTYTDLAAGGEAASYTVRGVDDNDNWADATVEVSTRVPAGAAISSADDLDDSQWFQNRFGEPFTTSESYTDIGEFSSVWGRKYPVYQTAGNADKSVSVNLGITGSKSKVEWLQNLCGKTCLYRDSMGNRFRGIITGVSDTTQKLSGERYHDISITVRQVEYDETIAYDPPTVAG